MCCKMGNCFFAYNRDENGIIIYRIDCFNRKNKISIAMYGASQDIEMK